MSNDDLVSYIQFKSYIHNLYTVGLVIIFLWPKYKYEFKTFFVNLANSVGVFLYNWLTSSFWAGPTL